MFTTSQLEILNAVLNSHSSELLNRTLYYVAYTTNTSDNDADLIIALSSEPITSSDGYTFYFSSDSYTQISCYSSNYYSGNYYSGKRVTSTSIDSKILSINIREFVSSNVVTENFTTLDFSDRSVVQNEKIYQTCFALSFSLAVLLLYIFVTHFFDILRRR